MRLVVAEKPSVARDLARVLGVRPTGRHAFPGERDVVTWCIGHLVELEEPVAYDARWKAWRLDTLPMLPTPFKLRPVHGARDQFQAVARLLGEARFSEVVNACDAGREGELIFRYLYDLAGCRIPITRLWISSMTDEAVRAGLAALKPGAQYDRLADAARCRSEADWIVGLNATRAVTVRHRTGSRSALYSVGRVQTPTLAILVARERAIAAFTPRDYFELRGTFTAGTSFSAMWNHAGTARLASHDVAETIVARVGRHATAADPDGPSVAAVQQKKVQEAPPLLFDLTSLQRTANRRFGMSASQTLQIAQALYERHKVLTYPRTDSRHLTGDLAAELPKLFAGLQKHAEYAGFARALIDRPPPRSRRVFDDARVQDHHAIIPTGKFVALDSLSSEERKVFDLVARRFLGVFFPDAIFALSEAIIRVGPGVLEPTAARRASGTVGNQEASEDEAMLDAAPPPPDRFVAKGRIRLQAGWQEVAGFGDEAAGKGDAKGDAMGDQRPEAVDLPPLTVGQRLDGTFEALAKKTRPPPRHSEATLLAAMETAGRQIEDEALRAAMKDTGLGTPATRAAIIETLFRRGFVVRQGKQLQATPVGIALIDALPDASLASPELTGKWEARLARIARGEDSRAEFMAAIAVYIRQVIETVRAAPVNRDMAAAEAAGPRNTRPPAARPRRVRKGSSGDQPKARKPPRFSVEDLRCPRCREGHLMTGHRGWGCSRWKAGCGFVVWFEIDGKRVTRAALKKLVEGAGGQAAGR